MAVVTNGSDPFPIPNASVTERWTKCLDMVRYGIGHGIIREAEHVDEAKQCAYCITWIAQNSSWAIELPIPVEIRRPQHNRYSGRSTTGVRRFMHERCYWKWLRENDIDPVATGHYPYGSDTR